MNGLRLDWCEVHKASVPVPADDWNKCYEWWIGEYNPDDPPLETCRIVSKLLIDPPTEED